ncbi:MBL fold metallo-hydrolase [Desulfobacterales bacterium HSG17]|nr:MBL fold metallo-hydrolase [Desulfobacterales bacterium HSG17]
MLTIKKITTGVHLVCSDSNMPWKCNGLLIRSDNGRVVLIDCNFDDEELKELFVYANRKPERYYITHVHVDHVINVHRIETQNIPIYCPKPEDRYIVNGELFMEESGAPQYRVLEEMKSFLFDFAGFKNINKVNPYEQTDIYVFDNIEIKPIHLPGHSPGHSGFIVRDLKGNERPVLFSSDMGIEKIGMWYGFKYSNISDIRSSLKMIEAIYESEDFILTGSHTEVFFRKQSQIFKIVEDKIKNSKMKILALMEGKSSITPDELVFKGVYYKISSINKMDDINKKLYFFWEGYTIRNLMEDLEYGGFITKSGNDKWKINYKNISKNVT